MDSKTYKQEEIFQDIPGDPDNVNMTIPPEVCEAAGIEEGDTVKIEINEEGHMVIIKVEEPNGEQ